MPIQRVCHLMIGQSAEAPPGAFIFTVQTTGADETFTLPLESDGTYDFHIDWGDSSSDDITVWNAAATTHTYASAGTHEVIVTGTLIGFNFSAGGDKLKIYEIKSWGIVRLGNNLNYFKGCSNLTVTATDNLDLTGTTDLNNAFHTCTSLTTVPSMNSWNMSEIVNLYGVFYGATLFNQNIGNWDVSNVENFSSLFSNAAAFNQNIGNWVTSSATLFRYTFDGAISFDQDLSSWNVVNVYAMTAMFNNVTLSTTNWSAILIGFEAQDVLDNVPLHGGNSKYSAGAAATARQALIDDHTWVIQDGGLE